MRTSAQRIARYQARMLSSLIDPTLSAVNATQQANFAAYVNDFVPRQVALRAILNDEGVSVIQVAGYEAFHGELYGLSLRFAGPTLQTAFCNLVTKWSDTAHLGAGAETVLLRIGADIYALDACGTP
jgi:hypothetical protein